MRDILEQLLRTADVPNLERAQLLWDEYRTGADSPDARTKTAADGAFATLLAWYGGAIYRHIWGFIRSDAAEDVFQDVLRKLHEKRRSQRLANFHASVLPWLRQVAIRDCVDEHRRSTRRRAREVRAARPESTKPADNRDELQEVLSVALAKLSREQQQAIALHYFEGMDKKDAAAILGIHRDTLATNISRALQRLQKFVPVPTGVLVGGTVGVPTALSAKPPVLSSTRLGELVAGAWAKAGECSWSYAKVAAVVLVGLALGGAATAAGWALTREKETEPAAKATPPAHATAAQVEKVSDRNRRVFEAEVLPKQLAALKGLAGEGGQVQLEWVRTFDTRVECVYRIHYGIGGTVGLHFIHNTGDRGTGVYRDLNDRNDWKPLDTKRPIILGRNPKTGAELVVAIPALEEARLAFNLLPQDDRTAIEARAHLDQLRRAITPFLGTWYVRGDPASRCVFTLKPNDGLEVVAPDGRGYGDLLNAPQVDTAGWVYWLPLTPGPARVSADGQRVEFKWSRELIPDPKK